MRATIDGDRLLARLGELRRIGGTAAGGVTREAFGTDDVAARELVGGWLVDGGLEVTVDAAANLVGRLPGRTDRWLGSGSHLDTVVNGGWLDGAYGVVAAVEVAAKLAVTGELEHGLIVAAFANEEGARGLPPMPGSRVAAGAFDAAELTRTDDRGETTLAEWISRAGGDPSALATATWDPSTIDAFVELHIEQGPVLDTRREVLGVVAAITGRQLLEISVGGRANHAGTTPMDLRRDALAAAAEVVLAIESVARNGIVRVATCGHVEVHPNVRNVVPGRVRVSAELRDVDADRIRAGVAAVVRSIAAIATARDVRITVDPVQYGEPVLCNPAVVAAATRAVERLGQPWSIVPSGAGHDVQNLAGRVPVGMLFVPSRGGVSHNPAEDTDPEHLVTGAQALLDTLVELDRTGD